MALRARFSFIRRILTGFWAPFLAGLEAESKEALSQSIWSASPRRFNSTRCSRSHTLACCHSRKRRQQVTPEPQPISWGNISQGMALFKTKMMALRAARSSTRGLPPSGLGSSGGNSGSTIFQSSSLTNTLAMFPAYPDTSVLKESLSGWRFVFPASPRVPQNHTETPNLRGKLSSRGIVWRCGSVYGAFVASIGDVLARMRILVFRCEKGTNPS
jgi:hypothetical protein